MAQYSPTLDGMFHALADPTRREVLDRLGSGPASVSELANHFDMALPSFLKHIRTLESAGWIRTRKSGRVRTCRLEPGALAIVDGWLEAQRRVWQGRTDRLEQFVLTGSADPDPVIIPTTRATPATRSTPVIQATDAEEYPA